MIYRGWVCKWRLHSIPLVQYEGIIERFAPHCFTWNRVLCLKNHDFKRKLGSTSDGSLLLEETPEGIRFELQRATPLGFSVLGVSPGFTVTEWTRNGNVLVEIRSAKLIEISLSTQRGAYRLPEVTWQS
jgi:phage head maturation protease